MMKEIIDKMNEHVNEITKEVHGYHGATQVPNKVITMLVKVHDVSHVQINGIDVGTTPDMILGHKIR